MAYRRNSYPTYYESSNAARQLDYDYDENYEYGYEEREYSQEEFEKFQKRKKKLDNLHDKRIKEQKRKNRAEASRVRTLEKSRGINLFSCVLFCIGTIMVYNLAVGYIDVSSRITKMEKEIVACESNYDSLKSKNDSELEKINSSIDYRQIYDIASKELGMVFAKDNQIIEFDDKEASYVRVYESIPDVPAENIVDDVLDSIK